MNCNDIKNILPLYLNNELDSQTFAAVKKHLKSCATCRAELSDLRGLDSYLKINLKTQTAPDFDYERTKSKKRSLYYSYLTAAALLLFIVFFAVQHETPDVRWENDNLSELIELNDELDVFSSGKAFSNAAPDYNISTTYRALYSLGEDVEYLRGLDN